MKSRKREAFQKQNKVTDVKIIRKIRRKIMKKKIVSILLASMLVIGMILLVRGRKQQVWLHGPCAPSLKAVLQNAGMFLLIVACFVQTVFNYL